MYEPLVSFLDANINWYKRRGRTYKRLALTTKAVGLAVVVGSLVAMAFYGAGAYSTALLIVGGGVLLADGLFAFSRNWLKFSAVQMKLEVSRVVITQMVAQDEGHEVIMSAFKGATDLIVAETDDWAAAMSDGAKTLSAQLEGLKKLGS